MSALYSCFDVLFLAYFARCLGFVAMLPFDAFSRQAISKFLIASIFAIFLRLTFEATEGGYQGYLWVEPLVGVLISIPIILILEIASMLGELIDQGRGQTIGSFYDPALGVPQSTLSRLFRWSVWGLILQTCVIEISLGYLLQSFKEIPSSVIDLQALTKLAYISLSFFVDLLNSGIMIYIPFAVLFLLVDYSIGVLGKVAPQVSLQAEAFQIKSFLAFSILLFILELGDSLASSLAQVVRWNLSLLGNLAMISGV